MCFVTIFICKFSVNIIFKMHLNKTRFKQWCIFNNFYGASEHLWNWEHGLTIKKQNIINVFIWTNVCLLFWSLGGGGDGWT